VVELLPKKNDERTTCVFRGSGRIPARKKQAVREKNEKVVRQSSMMSFEDDAGFCLWVVVALVLTRKTPSP